MKSSLSTLPQWKIAMIALFSSAVFFAACAQNTPQDSQSRAVDYHDSLFHYQGIASANLVVANWVHFDAATPGGYSMTDAPEAVAPANAAVAELLTSAANSYMPLVLLEKMKGLTVDETTANYTIEVRRIFSHRYSDAAILQAPDRACSVFAEVQVTDKSGAIRYLTGASAERAERYCRYDAYTMQDMLYTALDSAMDKIKVVGP
jgi:hypothetical protein